METYKQCKKYTPQDIAEIFNITPSEVHKRIAIWNATPDNNTGKILKQYDKMKTSLSYMRSRLITMLDFTENYEHNKDKAHIFRIVLKDIEDILSGNQINIEIESKKLER